MESKEIIQIVTTLIDGAVQIIETVSDSKAKNKGPIVKTGPTRGQVRSRNSNGRYRAKRSDAGKPRTKRS